MNEETIKMSKSEKSEGGKSVQSEQASVAQVPNIDRMDNGGTTLNQERKPATWTKRSKIILIASFLVFVTIVVVKFDLSKLQQLIAQNQKLTIMISFLALIITGLTLVLPTAPITLLISLFVGPLQAILITVLGNIFTALVHYQLGKQIGDVMNFQEKKSSLPFNLGKLPVRSPLFLLVGRGLPGGPKGLSFVCGAYGVPLVLYLWTTFVTELFGAVFIAYGGDELIKYL